MKKKQAAEYPPVPANTYTIDIPGMRDVFKLPLPYMQDKKLKRERYQRFKTAKSPVPDWLNWVPDVIKKIDDAQDLLYTAFFLAKPLLRKLPARFIPYVGWGLLLMDIMNLGTKILGLSMTPGLSKPCVRKTYKNYKRPKKFIRDIFRDFIGPTGWRRWLGFALQAPQALESLTGYGLVLGSVMGTVSNVVWSIPRILSGDKIVWRGPPSADPLSKAFNYLTGDIFVHNARDILTPEEHATLILAHNAALSIVFASGTPLNMERSSQIQNIPVITGEPWELSTLEMLEEEGVDLREDIDAFCPIKNPTYDQIIQEAIREYPNWSKTIRNIIPEDKYDWWSTVYQVYTEASFDSIEAVTGVPQEEFTEEDPRIKACQELASLDIMPLIPPSDEQLRKILEIALIKAQARHTVFPTGQDWKTSIEEICGPVVSKTKSITTPLEWNPQGG